jgi:hypothetical protein
MKTNNEDKFDVESLIKDFRILNFDPLVSYLKEVYRV